MDVEQFANPDWHNGTAQLVPRMLRRLLRDLALFVVLALVGEGMVRLLLPECNQLRFTKTITGGHPKTPNSRGLRDREFPDQPPPGETRIICLGNSTTFGAGVGAEDTYPKQLERLLNQDNEADPWFVINAGGEGGTVGQAFDFLANGGLDLAPAMVCLGYSPSMMARTAQSAGADSAGAATPSRLSPATWARTALRRAALTVHNRLYGSYLYVFLDTNIRRRLYRMGILQDRLDKPTGPVFAYAFDDPGVDVAVAENAYLAFAKRLRELKTLLEDRKVPLVVLGIPSRFEISDAPVDNERGFDAAKIRIEPLDRIGQFCRESGIPFVDLRPRLREERQAMLAGEKPWDDLYIPYDYSHLNGAGLGLAARLLRTEIERPGRLRQPVDLSPDGHRDWRGGF